MTSLHQGMVIHNLNLKAGNWVVIKGVVAADAKCFVINLGRDDSAIVLHFSPRFEYLSDVNTIVCNSKDGNRWGVEQRESAFPFKQGDTAEVCVYFDKDQLTIKLQDGQEMKFPNRLGLETANFLSAEGFCVKSVRLD